MTDCNIIIPTYNRPNYLHRILDYYDSFGEKFGIIIADSSSDENKKLNKGIIASVSNLNIQYLDHYSAGINPHHKMADMVNYAKTQYCVLCADDDFVTPEGIRQSVDFLEQNADFAVAQGRYIAFKLESDKRKEKQFLWTSAYSTLSIESSEPKSRLEYHLSNYLTPTIYGVHRTDLLKFVYQEVLKSNVDPVFFGELLPSMLVIIYGKMKCLDVFYAARDGGSITQGYGDGASARSGSWPTLKDAIETGRYDREYAKFRDCLATHLSKQTQSNIEESRKVVDEAMSAYLKKCFYPSRSKMGYVSTNVGAILAHLNLPEWLIKRIRESYARMVGSPIKRDFIEMSPSSKYYEDFDRVRYHVLYYSE